MTSAMKFQEGSADPTVDSDVSRDKQLAAIHNWFAAGLRLRMALGRELFGNMAFEIVATLFTRSNRMATISEIDLSLELGSNLSTMQRYISALESAGHIAILANDVNVENARVVKLTDACIDLLSAIPVNIDDRSTIAA